MFTDNVPARSVFPFQCLIAKWNSNMTAVQFGPCYAPKEVLMGWSETGMTNAAKRHRTQCQHKTWDHGINESESLSYTDHKSDKSDKPVKSLQ